MNKLIANALASVSLVFSFSAQANIFEIELLTPLHEIAEDSFAIVEYEIGSASTKEVTAEVKRIDDTKLIMPGVAQICGDPKRCLQSCDTIPVDPTANGVCQGITNLNPGADNSCKLLLCINGTDLKNAEHQMRECQEGDDDDLQKCEPTICMDPYYSGSCDHPDKEDALNIKVIPPEEEVKIEIVHPVRGIGPYKHLAILTPGKTYDFVLKDLSLTTPAENIRATFTDCIGDQLQCVTPDCTCTAQPDQTCTIEVSVDADAKSCGKPEPVSFKGTNTNEVHGYAVIERPHALEIEGGEGIAFNEPGINEVFVRNTNQPGEGQTIYITHDYFTGIEGVELLYEVIDGDDCRIRNHAIVVPAGVSCGINLKAHENALQTHEFAGSIFLIYRVGDGLPQKATKGVFVAEVVPEINDGNPIPFPRARDNTDTEVQVEIENTGKFLWQDVSIKIRPRLRGVHLDTDNCPKDFEPGESCFVTLSQNYEKPQEDGDWRDKSFLIAKGKNGHGEERIVQNSISIFPAPARFQHLQYQGIVIFNNGFSEDGHEPQSIKLKDVFVSDHLRDGVKWCASDDSSCLYRSSCEKDEPILPGRFCLVWLKSEESYANPSVESGEVFVTVAEGGDLNAIVTKSLPIDKAVKLYAAGDFEFNYTDESVASNITQWDGTTWSPLGSDANQGLSGTGHGMAVYNGDLVVVGSFADAAGSANSDKVALWRGNAWSGITYSREPIYINHTVNTVNVERRDFERDRLVIGGEFYSIYQDGFERSVQHIAEWSDNLGWIPLGDIGGNGTDAPVTALANCATENKRDGLEGLCVGGSFRHVLPSGESAKHIAAWNSDFWSVFGKGKWLNGTNSTVFGFLSEGTDLYVVGEFNWVFGKRFYFPRPIRAKHIARWDNEERSWHHVGNRKTRQLINGSVYAIIRDFRDSQHGNIMIGGDFGKFDGKDEDYLNHVAQLKDNKWETVANGLSGPVYSLTSYGNTVYAGGSFDAIFPAEPNNIAQWSGGETWQPIDGGITTMDEEEVKVNSVLVTHSIEVHE